MVAAEAGAVATTAVSTLKIKPKPKKTTTVKAAATAAAEATVAASEEVAPSAPIEQIEKKIQKRTKKAKMPGTDEPSAKDLEAGAAVKPKRQTKKKTDL